MLLQKFKAKVEKVSDDIAKTGKKTFRIMVIIKPAPVDEMGDTLFKDDYFSILVPENKINLVKDLKKGDKISVELSLNGQQWIDSNNKEQITHNLKLYKLEKIA